MKKLEQFISIALLLFAVCYNLWLYRLEPTAKIDPNDNPFQYALVHRTNEMWDFALRECPKNPLFPLCFIGYLSDHWVPNWAQGYNLPFYYSHTPQIAIVTTHRLLSLITTHYSLFTYYHIIIYLLLCLFPISVYFALKVMKVPPLVAGFGALIAAQISTDGLYGLDPSSFLWRGYGLSSQLFAMVWMPLAVAHAHRFLTEKTPGLDIEELLNKRENQSIIKILHSTFFTLHSSSFLPALLFLTLSTMGHLGLGVITMLSVAILAISPLILGIFQKKTLPLLIEVAKEPLFRMTLLTGISMVILSYWILPVFLYGQYHNTSFWDPVWKFNSWGWKDVIIHFLNGDLFDFGRFPVMTVLLILGGFAVFFRYQFNSMTVKQSENKDALQNSNITIQQYNNFIPFSFLFLFWLLMFFGRTTWGGLIDIIPSMKDFHQSRFIVGVHLAGFFLAPLGFWWLSDQIIAFLGRVKKTVLESIDLLDEETKQKRIHSASLPPGIGQVVIIIFLIIVTHMIYQQTYRYAKHNDVLIKQGNGNFDRQNPDVEKLFAILRTLPPGRIYPGRGGSWGKKLQIAETTYFMHLSTYGIPVILWLPETWSPNSDVEQFFVDDWKEHYDLLNIRYVVAPPDVPPQPFWKSVSETPSWKLYSVPTNGYFTTGSHAAVIATQKEQYVNVVRLWMQSDYVKKAIFPSLTFKRKEMMNIPLPAFEMIDEATYRLRDGKEYGLFGEIPRYEAPETKVTITGPEEVKNDMIFTTQAQVPKDCTQCLIILKQSFHPSWKAWINGKRVPTIIVFPFSIGIPVSNQEGSVTVTVAYQPSTTKLVLLALGFILTLILFIPFQRYIRKK